MTKSAAPSGVSLGTMTQIWSLLPDSFRGKAVRLWLMMVSGALLEMMGVGIVIPVITVLTQPDALLRNSTAAEFYRYVGRPNQQTLVVIIMLLLLSAYLIKNLFLAFLVWKQSKFIYNLQHALSTRLFATYLRQPYSFHLQRNSAHLVRNLQGEMAMFINAALSPSIFILAESLVVLGLFGMLMIIEPVGTTSIFGILLLAGWLYQHVTKSRVYHWGKQRILHDGARIKQLHHGLGGVKDVKLLGREANFLSQYHFHNKLSMKMNQRQAVMQQLPRLWLELLAISAFSILLISISLQGKAILSALPTLALFAAVSFRLMPSTNRIISAIQQLRFGIPVVDLLYKELNLPSEVPPDENIKPIPFRHSLILEQVSYSYPSSNKTTLHDISLTITPGAMVGFIGESGSGKSTLIDIMLGLLKPTTGRILVDGLDIHENMRRWQSQIGYVPQNIYLMDDTLRRNVAFGLADKDIDDEAIQYALKAAQLETFIESLPDGVETVVGERGVRLSGGQKQRIGIARALYHDPNILVLDEATSALDNDTETDVMSAVESLRTEKTVLIVAHRLSTIKKCDFVYRMTDGRLIAQQAIE